MHRINDSEGNVYIPEWVTRSSISDGAHYLYVALCTYAENDTRRAYVSIQQLAKRIRRSERTVRRYIAELVELGAITKDDASGDICFRFLSRGR